MPSSARLLQTSSGQFSAAAPPVSPLAINSDVVVILSALLCLLICIVGLVLVAYCVLLRRYTPFTPPVAPRKGLKKKVLQSLPRQPYIAGGMLSECPICLIEFAHGDEIRTLPQCGHGFHVGCVDRWLVTQSSCPSCRRVLVIDAAWCQQCGASSAASGMAGSKTPQAFVP